MTTLATKYHRSLLKLLIVLSGTLFMTSNAFACKWYDAPCKARRAAARLAVEVKAAEAAAAQLAQQAASAADLAAKQAAAQAAAAAAAAKAVADANFANLVLEKRAILGTLKNNYSQAASYTTSEYSKIASAASPFVTPCVNMVNGCMAEMAAEPANLIAQADAEVETGWINQDFQDAAEARAACANSIVAASQDLARRGQKLAGPEIQFISDTIKASTPCVTRPELCVVEALEGFYDDLIKGLVKDAANLATSAAAPVSNSVNGILNGAGGVTEAMYRVIREIPTGQISDQGKSDLHAVIKFLKLENSKGTAGIFFSPMISSGQGLVFYQILALDLNQPIPTPKFFLSSTPVVGTDASVKLGFFWSPYSGNDVSNKGIGYPIPIPLPNVPPQFTGMFYPSWLMPTLGSDMNQNLNNIKNSLMKSPTFMAGFMYNQNTGWIPTSLPVAPLRTRLVN